MNMKGLRVDGVSASVSCTHMIDDESGPYLEANGKSLLQRSRVFNIG